MKIPAVFTLKFWIVVALVALCAAFAWEQLSDNPSSCSWILSPEDGTQYRILFVLFAVATALSINYLIKRMQLSQSKYDNKISELREITGNLQHLAQEQERKLATVDTQTDIFTSIYTEYFQTIDNLSVEYFEKRDADVATRLTIVKRLEQEVVRMRTQHFNTSIIEWVNLHNNNIITAIATEIPKLKKSDLEFMALKLAGFSPKSIALIQDITIGNYYNKWTRLRARISSADTPHAQEMIALLNATTTSATTTSSANNPNHSTSK